MSDNKEARKFNTFQKIETLSDDGVFCVGQMVDGVLKFKLLTKAGFEAQFEVENILSVTRAEAIELMDSSQFTINRQYLVTDALEGTMQVILTATDVNEYVCLYDNDGQIFSYDLFNDTGYFGININELYMTEIEAPAHKKGVLWYDSATQTLSFYDNIEGTSNQINQEQTIRARNASGSTILDGQVVYIDGATGQNPKIELAQANALDTSKIIGVVTHDIANNSIGKVTTFGVVNEVNTSAFNEGDVLYLSATTAGGLTNVKPVSPNYEVMVGTCIYSNASNGKILVHAGESHIGLGTAGQVKKVNQAGTAEEWANLAETGTFTPLIKINNSITGIVQTVFQGFYTKIGDLVFVQMFIAISSKGVAVGTVTIDELPFTSARETPLEVMPIIGQGFANTNYKQVITGNNSKQMYLTDNYAQMTNTSLTDTTAFRVAGCYKVV